jgi:hypothetical protein
MHDIPNAQIVYVIDHIPINPTQPTRIPTLSNMNTCTVDEWCNGWMIFDYTVQVVFDSGGG